MLTEAQLLQREDVKKYRYLFTKFPDGRWYKNLHGTVLHPVWALCSAFEVHLLER